MRPAGGDSSVVASPPTISYLAGRESPADARRASGHFTGEELQVKFLSDSEENSLSD
jgi:hypothetical protein